MHKNGRNVTLYVNQYPVRSLTSLSASYSADLNINLTFNNTFQIGIDGASRVYPGIVDLG